jgi:hypothetical protein
MGGHTSSYAAAGIALEFIGAHKPPNPATKFFHQGGDTIKGELYQHILNYSFFKDFISNSCFSHQYYTTCL